MAERLLPVYYIYDFPSSRMLCDAAIAWEFTLPTTSKDNAANDGAGFLQHWARWFTKKGNTLHRLLTITVLADEMRLPTGGPMTHHYVKLHLHRFPGYYHADHMQTLHPLLQKGFFLDLVQPATFTPDEIASNLFPKLFLASLPVQLCPSCYARHLRSNETSIRISGAGTDRVNGLYQRTESALFSDRSYRQMLPDGGDQFDLLRKDSRMDVVEGGRRQRAIGWRRRRTHLLHGRADPLLEAVLELSSLSAYHYSNNYGKTWSLVGGKRRGIARANATFHGRR
jgi:hypothetical protein